jgi:hypothetical protein
MNTISRVTILLILNIWAFQCLQNIDSLLWGINEANGDIFNGLMIGFIEFSDSLLFAGEYIQAITRALYHNPNEFYFLLIFALIMLISEQE